MALFQSWLGTWRARAASAVVAAVIVAAPSPARAEEHKDEKLGYSFSYPRKWEKRPIAADETWIVAKFECDREFEDADPKLEFWTRHRPWLDVVVIPTAVSERKGGEVTTDPDGTTRIRLSAPWKDLKGYMEQKFQYAEGGFFFSKEEEQTVGGLRCMQYEVTFEKLTRSPRRVYAWAYYTTDAIYGFVGESLIRFEDKLKPDFLAAYRSFKAFPRKGALPNSEHTGDDVTIIDPEKDANTDAATKKKRRDQKTGQRLARIKDTLASDWTVRESANFIAVSHSDAKYTKSILDHAEAVRGWLDDNLAFVGDGYTGKVILRICKDQDEYSAFQETGGWSGGGVEVTTYKDKEGWGAGSWGPVNSLNGGIYRIWMDDRHPGLRWSMPRWAETGLQSLVESAESKGRKIEFRPSLWDKVELAAARRDGKLATAKSFLTMTSEELWADYEISRQIDAFTRFLVVGSARRSAKWKNLFADYMKAVVFVLDEIEAEAAKARKAAGEAPPSAEDEPKTEEEEERQAKARQESGRSNEKQRTERVNARVFGDWTAKDWDALNAAYWKDIE